MASSQITSGTDFNASDITYGKVTVGKTGGRTIPVNGKGRKGLMISAPLMLTWGANENDYDGSGKKSYDMALQFPSEEYPDEQAQKFLDNMKALEDKIKRDAVTNYKDWFNKAKMTAEVVDALFTPFIKYPKDKATGEPDSRAPTLRVKIPFGRDSLRVRCTMLMKHTLP